MQFYLISDNIDTLTGMRLTGVAGVVVHTAAETAEALRSVQKRTDIGVLLITEKLAGLCPELIYDIKLNSPLPLVVEIPDRHGTGRTPDSITRYVREAIGIKL